MEETQRFIGAVSAAQAWELADAHGVTYLVR